MKEHRSFTIVWNLTNQLIRWSEHLYILKPFVIEGLCWWIPRFDLVPKKLWNKIFSILRDVFPCVCWLKVIITLQNPLSNEMLIWVHERKTATEQSIYNDTNWPHFWLVRSLRLLTIPYNSFRGIEFKRTNIIIMQMIVFLFARASKID